MGITRRRETTLEVNESSSVATKQKTNHGLPTLTRLAKKKNRDHKKVFIFLCILVIFIIVILEITIHKENTVLNFDYTLDYDTSSNVLLNEKTTPQLATLNDNRIVQMDGQNNNISNKKPKFIIHVGPPKTGSTTLQCTLESLRSQLDQDGIVYIGRPECHNQRIHIGDETKKEFRLFDKALVLGYDCHKQLIEYQTQNMIDGNNSGTSTTSGLPLPSCWDDFIHHLGSYKEQNKHVIFSDEAMSNRIARTWQYRPDIPYPFQALKSVLENMGWDVQVLIIHRPLYDYLPSVYIEKYKIGPNKIRLRKWHEQGINNGTNCPAQNGRIVPRPFDGKPTTNEITIANLLDKEQKLYPTPAQVIEIFLRSEFNVIAVDMMEKKFSSNHNKELDFIQHIICNVFPATHNTCKALLEVTKNEKNEEESNTKQLNPSLSLFYDFIAVEACAIGVLNGTQISRDIARDGIQRYHEIVQGLKPNDLPLICPSDAEIEQILNASLDHQERICRNVEAKCNEEAKDMIRHQSNFWKSIDEKKKFCTVDTNKVLKETQWIEFLSSSSNFM
uniref:Uncharacterized protein n=1 Tax=Ditylum brightwellii TaxID=49249 RepID=A0A7S1Z3S5_9STRA|mmetsp:Transcript_2344/g.3661  ORF Transcript_2344/g.3661 Transcript_2344/m.3661 type:complete len:559 (+) Transcript_2344:33-1709(+)